MDQVLVLASHNVYRAFLLTADGLAFVFLPLGQQDIHAGLQRLASSGLIRGDLSWLHWSLIFFAVFGVFLASFAIPLLLGSLSDYRRVRDLRELLNKGKVELAR